MIGSVKGIIVKNGNVVRANIARMETIVRYLSKVKDIEQYQVIVWENHMPMRYKAKGFLDLHIGTEEE